MRKSSALMITCTLLVAHAALANESGKKNSHGAKIIIVSMKKCCGDEAWPEAETITKAEFNAVDIDVEVVDGIASGERERRIELGVLAEEKKAACALRIVKLPAGASGGVDLWITDRVTGKTVFRHLPIEAETSSELASIVALKVVELLRASLIELNIPDAQKGEVEAPPSMVKMAKEAAVTVEKPPGPVGLRLGAEGIGSPGGAGAIGGVNLGVRWTFKPYLSLEIDGLVSLIGKDIKHEGAGASFDLVVARAWFLWEIMHRGFFRPSLGAGGGIILPWAKGSGPDIYDVTTDKTTTGYIGASAQLALVLTRSLWLRFGVNAGAALPKVRIKFSDEEVASFGMPLIEGFLNIEVKIP